MPDLDLSKVTLSDQTTAVKNFEQGAKQIDGLLDQVETEWINPDWTLNYGFFFDNPDVKSALTLKAIWNVGKGFTTDNFYRVQIDRMRGNGKETFEDILFDMELTRRINGDSFAEIVRNEAGIIINIKTLNPGNIKIIFNKAGRIIRYEQIDRPSTGKDPKKFRPQDIFHLTLNKIAGQIHGISDIDSMKATIEANKESFDDIRQIMHRQARPFLLVKLKTDDQTKINEIVAKFDDATKKGENVYIPDDEDIISVEVIKANVSDIVLAWRDDLRNGFYRSIMMPQVIPGAGGQSTESESKVIYFAFENITEDPQRYLERQIWNQLAWKIDLIPPPTMQVDLQKDGAKDGPNAFQPSDTIAGRGR